MTRQPICKWLIVADRAETDEEGFLSLIRIYNMVEVEALDRAVGPLTVVTYWENGPPGGEAEFAIRFRWPNGQAMRTDPQKVPFGLSGRGYGIVDFPEFVHHAYGEMQIEVIADGEVQLVTVLGVYPSL